MSIIGSKIGRYEVLELMGVGGMGEVYRARDLTLDRQGAIKREAKVLAQLDHPNIAAIYGLEESASADGASQRLLIMQLAEGDTLGDWIGTARLTTERALEIGLQIAAGLESAHERGVVHRDLKPANVKVSEDAGGHPHVRLLDFGLAKVYEPDGSASDISPELSASPTELAATRTGVILGTAAYMSPEQARGRQVDKRADIWAFGVVMFEMLTGRRLFGGESVSDMLAGVLKTDPDFSLLPPDVPPRVVQLLQRCLVRDPTRRLRDVGEARLILENPGDAVDTAVSAAPTSGSHRKPATAATQPAPARASPGARLLPWVVSALAIAIALWSLLGRRGAQVESYELAVGAPIDSEFLLGSNSGNVIISPDGTKLAFVATTEERPLLWVRPLDRDEPVALPGTENPSYPFWSPDSSKLAFFANGMLKSVDVSGGLPEVIADAPQGRGGSWGANGTIVFTPNASGTVHKVVDTGGEAENITSFDAGRGENAHYWPQILPDGERFLFFARGDTAENSGIYLAHIDGSTPPARVVASMSSGVYALPRAGYPGHLLWVRDGSLLAQPFDLDAGRLTGTATTIAADVRVQESQRALFASVSGDGVLAWATARAADNVVGWYNRQGLMTGGLEIEPGMIQQIALSPDGEQLLFSRPVQGTSDIWLHDVPTGTTRAIIAGPGYEELPGWSADGERVFYADTAQRLMMADPDGIAGEQVIYGGEIVSPGLPSVDARYLLFIAPHPDSGRALAVVSIDDPGTPTFLTPGSSTPDGAFGFSPDGEWVLLLSQRSGNAEYYAARWIVDGDSVRLGEPWVPVSANGASGFAARWTSGGEIIFSTADNYIVSVPVSRSGSGLELGREQRLFRIPDDATFLDVAADGQRFVMTTAPYAAGQTISVLTNWHSRLPRGR